MTFHRDMFNLGVRLNRSSNLIKERIGLFLDGSLVVIEIDFIFYFDFVIEHKDDLLTLIGAAILILVSVDGFRLSRTFINALTILGISIAQTRLADPWIANTVMIIIDIRTTVFIFESVEVFGISRARIIARAEEQIVESEFIDERIANTVTVGPVEALYRRSLTAGDFNWISGAAPDGILRCRAKPRYRAPEKPCAVSCEGGKVVIKFDEPQRAVTPGQAIVLYDGETVLGGGVIINAGGRGVAVDR